MAEAAPRSDAPGVDAPRSDAPGVGAPGVGRRVVLRSAGLVGAGLAAGGLAGAGLRVDGLGIAAAERRSAVPAATTAPTEPHPVSFYGDHQPGVVDPAPDHLRFVAFDLAPRPAAQAKKALADVLRAWSTAAADMMAGRWIKEQGNVADRLSPAGLTITLGVSASVLRRAGVRVPAEAAQLPHFSGEVLDPARSDGDLGVQVCGDDPMVVASAVQGLVTRVAGLARPRWNQAGFLPGATAGRSPDETPRNLMGQLDGTDNPTGARLELAVWAGPGGSVPWMAGGTYLVCRRIRMLLEDWQRQPIPDRERVIGRTLETGAPLSGGEEHTVPDFTYRGHGGALAIPADAHVRLTNPANNGGATMLRRVYSFDDGWRADGARDAGLFFQAFQTDPRAVFVPVQRRLVAADALSRFIRHETSAVFAIPPGAAPGSWVGEAWLAS